MAPSYDAKRRGGVSSPGAGDRLRVRVMLHALQCRRFWQRTEKHLLDFLCLSASGTILFAPAVFSFL
jgi:hypothetical protein